MALRMGIALGRAGCELDAVRATGAAGTHRLRRHIPDELFFAHPCAHTSGAPGMGACLEVQVLPRAGHSE